MPDRRHRGRQLRDVFITLALIFLLGAGAAYGATRYLQSGLESDATRDARKLSVDVLQPLLVPSDAQGPVRGVRYDELLADVDARVQEAFKGGTIAECYARMGDPLAVVPT